MAEYCKHMQLVKKCLPCRWGMEVFANHVSRSRIFVGEPDDPIINATPGLTPEQDRKGHKLLRRSYLIRSRLAERQELGKSRRILSKLFEQVEYNDLRLAYVVRFCGKLPGRRPAEAIRDDLVEDICENDPK